MYRNLIFEKSIRFEVKDRYDFTQTRNISTLIAHIKAGWNGCSWQDDDIGECVHKPVDRQMCQNFIRHCVQELEGWIKRQPEGSNYHPNGFSGLQRTFLKTIYNHNQLRG